MKTKHIFLSLLVMLIASIAIAPEACAEVNNSINGFFKKETSNAWETIYIEYSPSSGKATVWYNSESSWDGSTLQHFVMKGRVTNGWLKVSGSGTSHGRKTTMNVKITLVDRNTIRVVVGNGNSYYFYRD